MEIINKAQEAVLQHFRELPDSQQFYLTGGTALSYFYLKHRQSRDLDFFTAHEGTLAASSYQLETHLKSNGFTCERQRGFNTFVELVVSLNKETTLIHLAVDAAFRFEPVREFSGYPGLQVDSLVDIATNKLLALFSRAALRDFIDVYCLVQKGHFSKQQLMDDAKRKDPGFDLYWLGVAFERINKFDSNSVDITMLIEPISIEEIHGFFNQWRKEIAAELVN